MKNKSSLPIFFILLFAFVLRVYGIDFGLYHADEPIVVNHALAFGTGDLNPHFFKIPPLPSYLLFVVYGSFYVIGKIFGFFIDIAAFQALFIRDPQIFYMIGRFFLGVLPGVLTVVALYFLAKKYYSEKAALLSALFLAVNFLHVRDSHYIYVDIIMSLGVLLAAFSMLGIMLNGRSKDYILAGLWIGIATATKYNAAIVGAGIIAAHFLRDQKSHRNLVLGIIMAGGTYAALNPFSIIDFTRFKREILAQSGAETAVGFAHHLVYSLAGSAGWGIIAASFCGILLMVRDNVKKSVVILIFPSLFYVAISLFSQHHERYALPLVPFLCLSAGFGISELFSRIEAYGKRVGNFLKLFLMALLLCWPATKCIQTDLLFSRTDTRTQMKEWIEQNISSGAKIAFSDNFYRPALSRSKKQWEEIVDQEPGYQQKLKNTLLMKYQDTDKPSYFLYFLSSDAAPTFSTIRPIVPFDLNIINEIGIQYSVAHYKTGPAHETFYEALKRNARLVKKFSPYADEEKIYSADTISDTCAGYSWAELFSRESFGPVLEIYRLN